MSHKSQKKSNSALELTSELKAVCVAVAAADLHSVFCWSHSFTLESIFLLFDSSAHEFFWLSQDLSAADLKSVCIVKKVVVRGSATSVGKK